MVLIQKVQDEMQGDPFYRLVRYEDLCWRLEASMQDLCGFCDLKWNRQTKRFIARLESSQRTEHGYFDILRSPLSSVHNWRQALSEEQVERILGVVRHAPVGRQFLVDEGASMPYRPDCVVGNRERRH